jgi:MarR family transcriptional regulator, negative regulator of the multidrug operon emrRAB
MSIPGRTENLLGVAVLAAADRTTAAIADALGSGGAAPGALVHLAAHPGESTEALHRVLRISQPATVQVVGRLVDRGLVERRPGRDRRTHALQLTPEGRRVHAALLDRRGQALAELLAPLDEAERGRLEPLLEKIVAGLADDRPGALTVCRLCDRGACYSGAGCPLDHTSRDR